ncbi:hypothetical protein CEV08_03395 [Bartonella tribocorum]|uniref:Uncharacterized protein n=1 Tax=Bartonella tribocorum TaxID=85701 RepID=A0A2M6UWI8_9HYPH|nr:hypothetical protein CEV08_03395 [Bartonella tribocorum]
MGTGKYHDNGFFHVISIEMLVYSDEYTIYGGCCEMGLEALRNVTLKQGVGMSNTNIFGFGRFVLS